MSLSYKRLPESKSQVIHFLHVLQAEHAGGRVDIPYRRRDRSHPCAGSAPLDRRGVRPSGYLGFRLPGYPLFPGDVGQSAEETVIIDAPSVHEWDHRPLAGAANLFTAGLRGQIRCRCPLQDQGNIRAELPSSGLRSPASHLFLHGEGKPGIPWQAPSDQLQQYGAAHPVVYGFCLKIAVPELSHTVVKGTDVSQ